MRWTRKSSLQDFFWTSKKPDKFKIEQLDLSNPKDDEVWARIVASGMCHTDLAARVQHSPILLPSVLGHKGGRGREDGEAGDQGKAEGSYGIELHVLTILGVCGLLGVVAPATAAVLERDKTMNGRTVRGIFKGDAIPDQLSLN